jgi:hypothetical protein
MYYWLHGTLALHLAGGEAWLAWRDALLRTLLPAQRDDEGGPCGYRGSWDPVGPWGPDGGRVYATAAMAWALAILERPMSDR